MKPRLDHTLSAFFLLVFLVQTLAVTLPYIASSWFRESTLITPATESESSSREKDEKLPEKEWLPVIEVELGIPAFTLSGGPAAYQQIGWLDIIPSISTPPPEQS